MLNRFAIVSILQTKGANWSFERPTLIKFRAFEQFNAFVYTTSIKWEGASDDMK